MIACYKYVKPLIIFFQNLLKKEEVEFKETFEKKIEVLLNKIVISIVIFHESSVQN